MKINSRIIAAVLCSVCLIWIGACSSPKPQEEQGEEFEEAVDQLEDQLVGMLDNIPPPSEIPYIIQSTGADFDMSLLNDINKVDRYQTDNDKAAMNLGVYATDIGYLSSYDQSQEALNYFNGSKSMGDQIGVSSAIDDERVQQIEASLCSKEELGVFLDAAIDYTQGFLEESGRERTDIFVASGTFSEGLHIISSLVEQFPKTDGSAVDLDACLAALAIPLVRLILEQEEPAAELNELLQSVSGDPTTDKLVSLTSELVAEYESLNIQETFEQNQAITFLQKGTMDSLVDKIKNLRAYITG